MQLKQLHKVINIGVVSASTLLFALPANAQAQKPVEQTQQSASTQVDLDEVEVTASRAPIALNQATKIVTVIPAQEIAAAPVTSIQDLLEYAAGVDVRQRGEGGTQADISIRGGTFDQIAVLLNGINLSNPQTGHYSFDIPVNLSDIERIEVISGPSSRVFGASAFAGAINIITKSGQSIRMLDKTTNTLFFLMHAKRKHTGSVYKTEEIIRLSEKPSSDNASL